MWSNHFGSKCNGPDSKTYYKFLLGTPYTESPMNIHQAYILKLAKIVTNIQSHAQGS